jgi:DNA-binding FrmR family transcriptional regulator
MNTQTQKKAVNHLHRIQGQIGGLERMVENNKYCVDIIRLSLAVQKSLQSFNQGMLENHLKDHVSKDWKSQKRSKEIQELLEIYLLANK